jgi:hypothetical protein
MPPDDCQVVLDRDAPRIDFELREEGGDGDGLIELEAFAVERDDHGWTLYIARPDADRREPA